MLKEFRAFVLRGNVVDLAVGVVIGAAFGRVIDAIVKGMFNPLMSLGAGGLDDRFFCVGATIARKDEPIRCDVLGPFQFGRVLSEILTFLVLAAVIFFFVVKPANHLITRLRPETPLEEQKHECPECLSSIPVRARRCMFCTAVVQPGHAG